MQAFVDILIGDGLLPLIILVLVAVEAIGLFVLKQVFGFGPGLAQMAGSLLSGACLVAALYLALTGARSEHILLCLTASFIVHFADLAWRMRTPSAR